MKAFIAIFAGLFMLSYLSKCERRGAYDVGVGKTQVDTKIDLTDKLDPQILPDVLKDVFASIQVEEKPDTKKFQQMVVQKFSQAVMDDPEVNYRVDLNEDGTIDPLMVVPENVENEAAVYSLRVPDPSDYPKDPGSSSDWDKIADKQSIELVEVGVTFDEASKQVAISSTPNQHVYEKGGANSHYTQQYPHQHHNWIQTYFQYRLFSMVLFGPYGWGFGPFYGGYYGGFYRPYPVASRAQARAGSRYSNAPRSNQGLKTASGKSIKGTKAGSRSGMPKSIKQMKSRRAMAVRKQKFAGRRGGGFGSKSKAIGRRSGGFGSSGARRTGGFGRSRSRSFGGGGSRGWGGK
ncbi:hypothetical protein ACFL5V_05435 [Fibrobacterota bacterium]